MTIVEVTKTLISRGWTITEESADRVVLSKKNPMLNARVILNEDNHARVLQYSPTSDGLIMGDMSVSGSMVAFAINSLWG